MVRYIYQASSHMPPWALSYEWEFTGRRLHLYITLYSEELETPRKVVGDLAEILVSEIKTMLG